ncbi:MAG: hypothetical protein ACE5EF_11695, partial [Dehalococcoidia bacterium]
MPESVLVVITETDTTGAVAAPGLEAIGLGLELARGQGGDWVALVASAAPGPASNEAAERGAARVYSAELSGETPAGDQILAALVDVAARERIDAVVVNRGTHVLDVAPRAAARLGGGCIMGVTEVRREGPELRAVASIYGGAARGVYRLTAAGAAVLSPAPGAAEAPERRADREAPVAALTLTAVPNAVRVIEPLREPEGPRLEDAAVVVSGGRGIKKAENYALVQE